ncbi:VOC family protein [Frankia sp. AgPm24]|uniref:VOC family protein n=1 Tax=Frankia sp. AgPm24 TaxID=631128 RepID=UPI00200CD8BC|nr:VOC family protein [Frankia sp. AgPm24]MCK9923036.1 VOC family protein [Frankia sp. AgPm24]
MSDAAPPFNTVAWFQISTDTPGVAKSFYSDLFGWRFAPDDAIGGYEMIRYAGADKPSGGLTTPDGGHPKGAIFNVLVRDVPAVCAEAERQGGKVHVPPVTTPDGLVFAELTDPTGNIFGVFTPPAG